LIQAIAAKAKAIIAALAPAKAISSLELSFM
jgi:hypothetical protein